MRTVRTVAELRVAVKRARTAGATIGLVPTMGFLHEGHLSLVRRARERCDAVIVSLFVNPAQFDDAGDLATYPRDEARDAALATGAGADILFAPPPDVVYPPGFATTVAVRGLSEPLEGAHRGVEHFDGVTTVVTKLLNVATPDVAFFGQKDAQQALVIRMLVRDLDMPVEIEVLPTVRDADGIALSSRNARLSRADRERARALGRALRGAETAVADGERNADRIRDAALVELLDAGIRPDYVELVASETLAPLAVVDRDALLAIAARVGGVRLIDNTILSPPEPDAPGHAPPFASARSHA